MPSTVELIVKFAQPLKAFRAVDRAAKKTNQTFEETQEVLRKVTKASLGVKASVEATQKSLPKLSQVQGVLAAKVRNSEQAMRSQIKALRDLQVRVRFNGSLYNKLGDEIAKYEAKLNSANRAAEKAKTTNNGLAQGLRRLAVGFGAARAAQATLQAGIRRDESERRLRLLTQRFGETAQAQEAAQRAADKFNLSQTEANVQLSRLIARLRPMGLSMATIETAFAGFNTATILAGATASESAGAFLQLSQALGSGVLRGQELNSILEQAPLIAQAIATEMGVTVGALKKLGEEGKITSEIVIRALGLVEREGAGQLTEALKGPAAAIKSFQNAAEDVQVALTQDIIPEMATSFRELAVLIESLGPLFRTVGGGLGESLGNLNSLISLVTQPGAVSARKDIERGRRPTNVEGSRELFEPLGGKQFTERLRLQAANAAKLTGKDVEELYVASLQRALKTLDAKAATLPSNFDMMVMNAAGPKKKPTELSDEEKKRLEKIQEQGLAASERLRIVTAELAILQESDEIEKIRLQFALEKANVQANYAAQIEKALTTEERQNLEAALRLDLQRLSLEQNVAITGEIEKQTQTFSDQLAHQDELSQLLVQQNDIFAQIGQTIEDGLVRGIEDAITGAKSLGEALSDVLKSVGSMFLKQGISSLVGGIFGGFGGGGGFGVTPKTAGLDFSSAFMASGGFVDQPTRAVIGEGGESEYVIPSSKMNEAMGRYARGARGGAVIPDGPGGDASGGMTGGGGSIDVSYSVERINNVNYVTAAEFERGMAQAAKRGAELGRRGVYSDLVNKRSVRSRVGV